MMLLRLGRQDVIKKGVIICWCVQEYTVLQKGVQKELDVP